MIKNVLDTHERRVQALIEGDLATLDLCVSDELVFTTPYGTLLTKAMVFDSIKNGDTAVITYRSDTSYTDNKVLVDGTVRSTTVYLFRDGRWQLIAAQQSLITGE